MRIINTLFLAGLCGAVVAGCSSNEEVIEVEKPQFQGATSIDLTTGQIYDDMGNPSDYTSLTRGVSSRGVQIFSLDDAGASAAQPARAPVAAVSAPELTGNPAAGYIGNRNVQIWPVGQPDIAFGREVAPPARRVLTPPTPPFVADTRSAPVMTRAAEIMPWDTGAIPAPLAHAPASGAGHASNAGENERAGSIYFDHASTALDTEDLNALAVIAQQYRANPTRTIRVEGFASERTGVHNPVQSKDVNLKISTDRAYAVARALIYSGVPADAIRVVGAGEDTPRAMDGEGGARRVDVVFSNRR